MKTRIRSMGNSQGVLIPRLILAQLGGEGEGEMAVEDHALVIRESKKRAREGWAEASQAVASAGDDGLVMGEFPKAHDVALVG